MPDAISHKDNIYFYNRSYANVNINYKSICVLCPSALQLTLSDVQSAEK